MYEMSILECRIWLAAHGINRADALCWCTLSVSIVGRRGACIGVESNGEISSRCRRVRRERAGQRRRAARLVTAPRRHRQTAGVG